MSSTICQTIPLSRIVYYINKSWVEDDADADDDDDNYDDDKIVALAHRGSLTVGGPQTHS